MADSWTRYGGQREHWEEGGRVASQMQRKQQEDYKAKVTEPHIRI